MQVSKTQLKSAIDCALQDRREQNKADYKAINWNELEAATAHLDWLLNTAKRLGWHDLENYALANL
jgi:hypothetical protein